MARKILHLDLDAFFCAAEARRDPALRGRPFVIGGRPEQRGVVASCSYEARRFGVRSAMPMAHAMRLCPELLILPADRQLYHQASEQVMAILRNTTPLVEQLSIDEAFLDVSLLAEPAESIARHLQAVINADLELPVSLGVASNKLVAKIANNVGKAEASRWSAGPPNAIRVVPPGQEAAFLAPLPITELWGVGPRTAASLTELGIHTIGDLAAWPEDDLVRRFGAHGRTLAAHARGLDDREVETDHAIRSISRETTFDRDVVDGALLRRTLRHLCDEVGRQTRREGLAGTTVKIKLRWSDFTTLTRQMTRPAPTDQDDEIAATALELFSRHWPDGRPVRLIGVGLSRFTTPTHQLGLWENTAETLEKQRLQAALDTLRDRFGEHAVQRGSDLIRRCPPKKK